MKSKHALVIAVILLVYSQSASAQQFIPTVSIIGKVTDAGTGEPLIGANVYIANTVLGAATDAEGNFVIFNVPYGSHKIVSSYIGYRVESKKLSIGSPEVKPVDFRMTTDISETGEVIVTEVSPKNWNRNLRTFIRHFLGTSDNASKCKILNPEALDFTNENGVFRAYAGGMLKIENRALGYIIDLHLEEFMVRGSEITMSYSPTFTEMDPETLENLEDYENERKRAYHGSLRHFLTALAEKNLDDEGYLIRSTASIVLEDDPAYYNDNQSLRVSQGVKEYEKTMMFDDYLMIVYKRESEEQNYSQEMSKKITSSMTYDPAIDKRKASTEQVSFIRQRVSPVKFNIKGILDNPFALTTYGYIAWGRIADELPSDYNPAPAGSDLYLEDMRPETNFIAGMEQADSLVFAWDYEYPLKLVLNASEKKLYNRQKTTNGKKVFLKRLIKSKNQNPLFSVNYWFLEFSGRYYHARTEFGTDEPPYYDIRGETYIRYGKPAQRYRDRGGIKKSKALNNRVHIVKYGFGPPATEEDTKTGRAEEDDGAIREFGPFETVYIGRNKPDNTFTVLPNESWYFDTRENHAVIHFVKEDGRWKQVPRLTDFLRNKKQVNLTWHWMELVKDRMHIGPVYSDYANQIDAFEEKLFHAKIIITLQGNNVEIQSEYDINNEIDGKVPDRLMTFQRIDSELYEKNAAINLTPEIENRFDKVNELKFNFNIAQFKKPDNSTRLEFTVHAPIKTVLDNRMTADSSDSITMNYQYIFRDSEFEPVIIRESENKIAQKAFENAGLTNIVLTDTVSIKPAEFDFSLQIEDAWSRNKGFKQKLQEIRDFSGDSLMISDILLLAAAEQSRGLLPQRKVEDILVTPYPFQTIRPAIPAFCYFELYNLDDSGGGNRYKIDITATSNKKKGFGEKLMGLFSRSKGVELSISFDRTIMGNDSKELIALDFSQMKPGDYQLQVAISNSREELLTSTARAIQIGK